MSAAVHSLPNMRRKDYGADETALRKAIDHLPDELFSTYHGAWQESISLALLDAIYFLHPTYEPHHPERGITGRVFTFAQEHPEAEDNLRSLTQLDECVVRALMGYAKTGANLRSEAVMEVARGLLTLTPPIVEARDVTGERLRDVRQVFAGVQGLGRVALTYFATNLGVPGAQVDSQLTNFVARYAYGDQRLRLTSQHVVQLVTNAYRRDDRGAESVSHFEHALWLGESRGHAP